MEKPGEHHKHLEMMAGTWDVKSKFYMIPGQTIEMTGMEVAKMQPGGFWLISDFTGKFMGEPFHGHGILGYEAHKKRVCWHVGRFTRLRLGHIQGHLLQGWQGYHDDWQKF